jgi:hypothetical protein
MDPPTAASNTSISIAGVPGEVSHQQVACFFPVASYGCSLTRSVSSNCWAYPTCHWREGGRPQLSQRGQSNVCRKTAEWVPLGHSHDGRLRFATNSLGRNIANSSGMSPSRNEQSRGCSHCPTLPTRADCLMIAALRIQPSAPTSRFVCCSCPSARPNCRRTCTPLVHRVKPAQISRQDRDLDV